MRNANGISVQQNIIHFFVKTQCGKSCCSIEIAESLFGDNNKEDVHLKLCPFCSREIEFGDKKDNEK